MKRIKIFPIITDVNYPRNASVNRQILSCIEFAALQNKPYDTYKSAEDILCQLATIIKKELDTSDETFGIFDDNRSFGLMHTSLDLNEVISDADLNSADVLFLGANKIASVIPVSKNLFWVEHLSGIQMAIIFKRFYNRVLSTFTPKSDSLDFLSILSNQKFIIYPFITIPDSYQLKDGINTTIPSYSSGTPINYSEKQIEIVNDLYKTYRDYPPFEIPQMKEIEHLTVPAYIINLQDRTDRRQHIESQFKGRSEFSTEIIEATQHAIGAAGLWQSIRRILSIAIQKDDDVILICEDDHGFTKHYSKELFLRCLIQAGNRGCDILIGGVSGGFNHCIFAHDNLVIVDAFWGTQFMVIFKHMF